MRAIDARIPTSYADADAKLNGKDRKRVAVNTEIVRTSDHSIGVSLHGTVVVAFMADGAVALNSGGWRTVTTKARMNSALRGIGAHVAQKAGDWFVTLDRHSTHRFFDGYTITPVGGAQ